MPKQSELVVGFKDNLHQSFKPVVILIIIIASKCGLWPCLLSCALSPAINGGAQRLCL